MDNYKIKIFLLLIVIYSNFSYGQEMQYKPFRIAIIIPDTVKLDNTLKQFLDTIPKAHLDKTYIGIKRGVLAYESSHSTLTEREYYAKMDEESKKEDELDKAEAAINRVKPRLFIANATENYLKNKFDNRAYYYNTASDTVLNSIIINKPAKSILKIADSLKANYVIYFQNISTFNVKESENRIRITAVLYARKENKILYQKETIGEIGGLSWDEVNPLNRLLEDGVRISISTLYEIIEKKQRK